MLLSQRTDATTLHTTVHMLDPQPTAVQRVVGHLLLPRELLATRFLRRHEDLDLGEREGQEAQILQQSAPGGQGRGVASAMRLSWTRPPYVSLRKRIVSRALTSRTFLTVWSFFLPL